MTPRIETPKLLDFLVVGAQKAGTTSLHEYLARHPRIFLPREKELPFFSCDTRYRAGWETFVRDYLGSPSPSSLWGKVTPRYMMDPLVPARIAGVMPGIKLIALLRNPIDRAISHYQMEVYRAREHRSLTDAISYLLKPEVLTLARSLRGDDSRHERLGYVVRGEYGRILSLYLEHFPPEQLLVLSSDSLACGAGPTLDQVLSHLGLPPGFRPRNLGRRYRIGGTAPRLGRDGNVFHLPVIGRNVRRLPDRYRRLVAYWFEQWNVRPTSKTQASGPIREMLAEHFRPDIARLEKIIQARVPWPEFRQVDPRTHFGRDEKA